MKKILSFVLSVVMIVSIFWISPVKAYAALYTITYRQSGTGASFVNISGIGGGGLTTVADDGNTVYFTVTIDSSAENCRVTGVTGVDGDLRSVTIRNIEANIYSFTMPDSSVSICVTTEMDSPGPTPDPTPAPATAPSHTHEWIEGEIYAATQDKDGLGGVYCKTCGAVRESWPLSAYEYTLDGYATPMINAAKSGQTITFELGEWNSFPKNFMEKISAKSAQGTTFVFHYKWNHQKQEIIIPFGTAVDTNFDWYGPAKMAELYGMN